MFAPPDPNSTLLFLIRHGSTEANERKPYILQGRGVNGPLSENGRAQVAALANFLHPFPFDHIFSSPLLRAQQTAAAICHGRSLEPLIHDLITEVDVGHWEGLCWDIIRQRDPDHHHRFHANPAEVPYKGGESYGDVLRRVRPVFDSLLLSHRGKIIAVVAHNVVNRVYLAHLLGLDTNRARDLHQVNACVNIIRSSPEKTELLTMNAAFHLRGIPLP